MPIEIKMKGLIIRIFLFSSIFFTLFSEVLFSDLSINLSNEFIFSASQFAPGSGDFSSLFTGDAETGELKALTFFPEKSWYNESSSTFFIQNRFGFYKSNKDFRSMTHIEGFDSFANGEIVKDGKIIPHNISPDGKMIVYIKTSSIVRGDLFLFDMESGESRNLQSDIDLSYGIESLLWSPDSKMFIYGKEDVLYYFSIDQFKEKRVLDEEFRTIGSGKLTSLSWNLEDSVSILYFIDGGIVYRLNSSDIFTRSLYSGEFNMSSVVGRVPIDFDPGFDSFNISPDGLRGLVVKNGGDLILYDMNKTDYRAEGKRVRTLPYLQLPKSLKVKQLIWAKSGKLVILASNENSKQSMVFTHDLNGDQPLEFVQSIDRGIISIALSPDEEKIILAGSEGVTMRTFQSWNVLAYRVHEQPKDLFWLDRDSIIVTGAHYTSIYNFKSDTSFITSFSQTGKSGFTKDGRILMQLNDQKFIYNEYDHSWTSTGLYTAFVDPLTYTNEYRLYFETTPLSLYNNRIMLKKSDSLKSESLFKVPKAEYDPFPSSDEFLDTQVFSHGSRVRKRELALVFNLRSSVEGLPELLDVLSSYQAEATFFVNGEFLRRHPDAALELERSGHEIGSMFYADFDMTDTKYQINEDFILRGLSYNEDEYFSATGKELEPLWHAPFYFVNSDIIEASAKNNYTYIGRDVDPLDWVATDSKGTLNTLYLSSSEIIERIMKLKQPGSIIPIMVGKNVLRDDYLFNKIDLLIEALRTSGYNLVTVSNLMENSK